MKDYATPLWLYGLMLISLFVHPLPAQAEEIISIHVAAERENAIYEKGETVRFFIDVKNQDGKALDWGSVRCSFSDDHYKTIEEFTLAITGQQLVASSKLERPGFLHCEVRFDGGERTPDTKVKPAVGAAAILPQEISPSREVPVDFEAFWNSQKELLAAVPVNAHMQKVEESSADKIEIFDVQISCIEDTPVSGYFARPRAAKPRSLPIILWVHGAGVRSSSLGNAIKGAARGCLSMDINAHGIPNGRPDAYYDKLKGKDGSLENYRYQGRGSRDDFYFKGMFLRLVRAIDFLTAQPEWDGRVVAVIGHSQGGAQALVAGGLDDRVTFVGSGVPAMCDHTGMLRRRISGWPKLVPILEDGKPDPVIAEVSRYYDAVNFANRCHADAIVSVGFIDRTCPPTSVYAAYNQLKGHKQVINKPAMGHAAPKDVQDAFLGAFDRHVAKRKAKPRD